MRIADNLRLDGNYVSPGTIRNLWIKEDIETKYKRLLRLEEQTHGHDIDLTAEQIKFLEKANPCFKERNVESLYPCYLLSQDTFYVGTIKGIGRVWLQRYNYERPHRGYRNMAKRPFETMQAVKIVKEKLPKKAASVMD
jgi:hypothetical protein